MPDGLLRGTRGKLTSSRSDSTGIAGNRRVAVGLKLGVDPLFCNIFKILYVGDVLQTTSDALLVFRGIFIPFRI